MLLTKPFYTKTSFFGSLISKVRSNPVASISLSSVDGAADAGTKDVTARKTLEERVGLPPRPKKPLTPYFRFMQEMRPKILQQQPTLKATDVVRTITKQWEVADENIKNRLVEEYRKEQQVYAELRTKYDAKITDEQRALIKEMKQEAAEMKERKILRKRVKELGRPKKPASAFLRFISAERHETPQTSNQTFRDWHRATTAKWARLSDFEKEKYMEESRRALEDYKKEIAKWEQKMIRAGQTDVVRNASLIDPPDVKPKKIK